VLLLPLRIPKYWCPVNKNGFSAGCVIIGTWRSSPGISHTVEHMIGHHGTGSSMHHHSTSVPGTVGVSQQAFEGCIRTVQEGYSSDTTSSDTSWVPPVIIFAHPFGNCWQPLHFWDLFFPQLPFFVLPLYVLFHPISMAWLPLPPLLIAGLHSALPNVRHCFLQRWRKQ
jgi:hypothetical protein